MTRLPGIAFAVALLATTADAQPASEAAGAQLRGIDKITGEIYDIRLAVGQETLLDELRIALTSCRFPLGNPAGDAFAALEIREAQTDALVFSGWMIASSPALSAMDHPRYDVWVMRCTTS